MNKPMRSVVLGALAAPCLAAAGIINDGTTTNGLSLVSNIPHLAVTDPPSASTLTAEEGGWVHLANVNRNGDGGASAAVRAAWIAHGAAPASRTLIVAADLRTSDSTSADRAGVIILNTANNKGVLLYIRAPAKLRLAKLDLDSESAADTVLKEMDAANYTSTAFATFALYATPSGEATTLNGIVTQGSSTNTITFSSELGDFMAADTAAIRVGYFGYYAADAPGSYDVGDFDNLRLSPTARDRVVIHQPGEIGMKCNFVDSSNYENQGNRPWIMAGHGDGSNNRHLWGLVQFTDLSNLPGNVASAKLELFRNGGSGTGTTLSAYQIAEDWVANAVVWTNQPAVVATPVCTITVPDSCGIWHSLDITPLYNAWKDGTAANHGVELRTGENNGETFEYRSSHYTANWTQQPRLVLSLPPPPPGTLIAVR